MAHIDGLFCLIFERVLLLLSGMWCKLECLLEASIFLLKSYGFIFARPTRPRLRTRCEQSAARAAA